MRLTLILVAAVLVGLCVWAVLRLCIDICLIVGRGVRSAFTTGNMPENLKQAQRIRARSIRLQAASDRVSRRASERLRQRMVRLGAFDPQSPPLRPCANPKCQWMNRPQAQFCAQCGRPLPQPRRAV